MWVPIYELTLSSILTLRHSFSRLLSLCGSHLSFSFLYLPCSFSFISLILYDFFSSLFFFLYFSNFPAFYFNLMSSQIDRQSKTSEDSLVYVCVCSLWVEVGVKMEQAYNILPLKQFTTHNFYGSRFFFCLLLGVGLVG